MKDTIRILHAADLHMDSPFEALSEEKAALRRKEQRELLRRLTALAAEREADVLLLAGDLLDTGLAYRETAETLCESLSALTIPVFIAPGNHDYYTSRSPWARLEMPENVHIFRSTSIESVFLPELDTEVYGAAFTDEACPPLLRQFTPPENPENRLRLLCMHGEVGSGEGKYNPVTESDLAASGMHYAAFGHVHACSGLCRAGETFYAWPGCAEGRGFDETGEKGVLLVDVRRQGCTAEFIPLASRLYHRLDVDLTDAQDVFAAVLSALPESAARDIFRITLKGAVHAAPRMELLRQQLTERVFALRLRDETRPARELWDGLEEDSLRGLFLRRLREKYDAAQTEEARETCLMALRFGLAAMDNAEEPQR